MTRDHFASITTPHGSVVTLTGLTSDEAASVAREAASDRPAAERAEGEGTTQCGNCAGKGGWLEKVETTTAGGGTVVTDKWVSCRPCKGMGTVPASH